MLLAHDASRHVASPAVKDEAGILLLYCCLLPSLRCCITSHSQLAASLVPCRLARVREISGQQGQQDSALQALLEGDFDPEDYDERMAAAFGDDYYGVSPGFYPANGLRTQCGLIVWLQNSACDDLHQRDQIKCAMNATSRCANITVVSLSASSEACEAGCLVFLGS